MPLLYNLNAMLHPFLVIDPVIKDTTNTKRTKLFFTKTPKHAFRKPAVLVTKFNTCLKELKERI